MVTGMEQLPRDTSCQAGTAAARIELRGRDPGPRGFGGSAILKEHMWGVGGCHLKQLVGWDSSC